MKKLVIVQLTEIYDRVPSYYCKKITKIYEIDYRCPDKSSEILS